MAKDCTQQKLVCWLSLALNVVPADCSLADSRTPMEASPPFYLHLFASYIYPKSPRLIVSAPIYPSANFDVLMDGDQHLTGRVEPRNGKLHVHLQGRLCSGTNVFDGEVELEKREEPGPQPYDVKAPFICQPHFILSANPDPKSFLKQQAAAEKKKWHLNTPLTASRLEKVKKQFKLMRPGMTKHQVFAMFHLFRYQNRLHASNPFLNHLDLVDYQLADGERLLLFFDNTGMGSKTITLADGQQLEMVDYASDHSHRIVVQAELDTVTRDGNGQPSWRTTLQWP